MQTQYPQPLGVSWVIAQLVLFLAILVAPFFDPGIPPTLLAVPLGLVVGAVGLLFALLGVLGLGTSLSIFPRPVENGKLKRDGIYGLARHPIYTGVILTALGYSIVNWSWLAIAFTVLLAFFFDRKSAFEEKMLAAKYPDYADYQTRVKKLIPWVY
ncbi:MAG: isoprenylcysteine carboxylmethyltransferase family protein [Anaerolineae bacterium]|nr:isoprenylcysteine carboxylmethyltransferase family protein [Anaerolineae bacterium]